MRKSNWFLVLIAVVVFFGLIYVDRAQAQELNLCTGSSTGKYYQTAAEIGAQAKGQVKVNVIETNGSLDNLERLSSGQCDAAIVQSDAYGIFVERNPTMKLNIERVVPLYNEYVHLVCNVNAKIHSVKDTLRPGVTVLTGPNGSGTSLTWETWGKQNTAYAKVRTEPIGGTRALTKVVDGTEAQCMLFVAGLKSGAMNEVNEFGKGALQLTSIDDGSFDDILDPKRQRVYEFHDIPAGTYNNLQSSGWFGSGNAVPTLTLGAVLVTNVSWIDVNAKGFENFSKAAMRWTQQNNR